MPAGYDRKIYEKNGQKYMKCPQCLEDKPVSPEFWYRAKDISIWYSSPCKECVKKVKKKYKESDRGKATIRAWRTRYEDTEKWEIAREKKRKYQKQYREKNRKKIADDQRKRIATGKHQVNTKTVKQLEKLWIRPEICPICWVKWDIIAHHPDYNKRYEIIFCCKRCHQRIHAWRFVPEIKTVNLKEEIKKFYLLKLDKWIENL